MKTANTATPRDGAPPSPVRRAVFAGLALIVFAGFIALGSWQLQRRVWKLDLIARVEQRVHAAPAPAPGPAQWPLVNAASDEYRRVETKGVFLNDRETLVQASTELGSGFWVMTPLRTAGGGIVMINRGFVAPGALKAMHAADAAPPASPSAATSASASPSMATVTGLLRISQPGGGFLRHNDPAADRWFSRDVQAIGAARGLDPRRLAPYFIDADAGPDAGRWPVGGLTVISFPNNHLVYALTWYALALMTAAAFLRSLRSLRIRPGLRPAWRPGSEPPILPEKQTRGEREGEDNRDTGNVR
ncbi:SURF1 family protein [Oxalobacteraceae bacterium CAVE-383]|nr:SURF1 family protein [Oxalobacteraceae bacterium CAVE-383]